MSPAGPESASNENKIQREQLRIDTFDRKSDGKVEGTDTASPEQVAERTKAYINRVNDVQGRVRSLRLKVEIGKDMRNPNWPALEKACNDVEGGLAQKLVAVTVENLESGIPEFSASIDRFLLSLQEEEVRDVRRYAAGSIDYGQLRRRSDEAYNTTLVAARRTGGVPHLSAIDEVIRSNEAELAHLKNGWNPPNWNFALWGTPADRRAALEGALPAYRKERNDVLIALPKGQATIQALCDRSDQAWVTFNTARSASPVIKQTVVEKLEFLIDVNVEERTHLSSYPNQGTVNDKTGEMISSRIKRIEDQLPGYRQEYAQLRDETAPLGVDSPKTGVQQLFEQLTAGSPVEPKLLQSYVKTATEVYGETPLRLIVSRVALVNKLNPAICEASGFPFRPPVDTKQLAVQLGRGVLPARPTPEQAATVTHAYLMGKPEDLIRRKYEFVLDRTVEPQRVIEEAQRFIQNETKALADETRNDADADKVARLAKNIRSAQESIRKEQECMANLQQILFHFESALTVFDATVAKNEGRQQESDRIYLKMREKYGPDLSRMDPDLGKRVTEAIEGLKKRNQLTPFELAMTEGRDQDAVKLAVDRQRGNIDSDYLAQARAPSQRVDIDSLSGRRRMRTEPGGGDDFPPLDLGAVRGARSGRLALRGGDFVNPREKFTKAAKEFLLSQNGQNGVTVQTVGEGNSFLTLYSVDTATVKGTFSCNFDGEWSFNQAKPSYRYGFVDANWFTDPAIPEGERNALNAIHRGLIERSDPEVKRRREERAAGPELGSYEGERSNPMFERQRYVSTSFSMFEFDTYGGKYDGQDVTVNITTNRTVGMGQGQPLFKLSVMGKDHLVGVADGFISKLAGVPNGMTAVLRRQPTKPTFGAVLRIPNREFGKPPRYEQLVSNYDSLTADDIAYVKLGRSMDEMREVESRGLAILAKHSPEITRRRDWSRGDAIELDTHVLVRKGGIVVEYLFSTTDGAWFCREIERDGKKFDELTRESRLTSTNRGFHPAASVRYSGSDAARVGFNSIGEELSTVEAGSTGRSGLQISGEPVANPAPAEEGVPALVNFRSGRRTALIPDIEKREAEESHDVLRAIDNDAAVRGVLSGASKISGSINLIQSLFAAGKEGTRRAGLVDLMREQAGSILNVLNDPAMKTNLLRARARLQELKRVNTGVDKSAIDQEIDKRIKAIDDMEAMMSKPDLRQFCDHIRDAGEYTESTFWNWLEENIVTIVAIVVAVLAVVLAVFTFGITSPLAVAAISATAGVIASEVTSEARFQLHQEFDEEVTSGRATFRNRSRTGAFTRAVIKDEKIFNPDTGTMEHADVLTHLVDPLGRDFVTGFVTTLAFMGAGAVIGKGLTVLANTNCAQALIANSPRLTRIVAYLSKAEQGAPLAQKNMKTFMSQWGKETAEEFRDEAAERIAGDWASVVFIAKKNFRPKNPADAKALARSDAAVRNMGEFQYETNGNPVLTIANITASLIAEGGTVTVDANGKITANIDGRVFLLSPDVEVSGLTPEMIASPPALPAAPLMTPLERENLMKMAEEARTDTKYLIWLKLFLKTNNVDDATRIEIAEKLLGRTLSDTERKAIIASHNAPGSIDNLTPAEVFGKARPLLAVMSRGDAQLLLDAAVCGGVSIETTLDRQVRSGAELTMTIQGQARRVAFVRVSTADADVYIMRDVATGVEMKVSKADAVTAQRDLVADEAHLLENLMDPRNGQMVLISGIVVDPTLMYFVRVDPSNPDKFVMRNQATKKDMTIPKATVLAALRSGRTLRSVPDRLPLAETLPSHEDFTVGREYTLRNADGTSGTWRYDGPVDDGPNGHPRGRFTRETDTQTETRDVALETVVDARPGEVLVARPGATGTQELRFESLDPEHPNSAIVTDAAGGRYRIQLDQVRAWYENTGTRPGQSVAVPPPKTEVTLPNGLRARVEYVREDGTVYCIVDTAGQRSIGQIIPLKDLKFTPSAASGPAELRTGPTLRRIPAAGEPLVVIVETGGRKSLQEGWVARAKPGSTTLEAYNPVTGKTLELNPETVFHPVELVENIAALRGFPEARYLYLKYQALNTPGALPLGADTYQRMFPPNSDFAQSPDVGNCYLVAGLHSLRQSPQFEALVRSAITPIFQEVDVPDPQNAGKTKKENRITAYEVRIPLGDPNGKIIRVTQAELERGQKLGWFGGSVRSLDGPVGFQVLEAAYIVAVHGRDWRGEVNRRASAGGDAGQALTALIGPNAVQTDRQPIAVEASSTFASSADQEQGKRVVAALDGFSSDTQLAVAATPTRRGTAVKDVDGNPVTFQPSHAYSIEVVNKVDKTVTLVDPQNTAKLITISYATFLQVFNGLDVVKVDYNKALSPESPQARGVKLAEAAHADPSRIAQLKAFLKANDVDEATRIEIAEALLGRTLGDAERKAIIEAHNAPGSIDNLSAAEIFGKARPLLAVMSRGDTQLLLDAAVCGKVEPFDARRMRAGQDYTVQTSSGRVLIATFLRVQGGKYIFSHAVGTNRIEVTIELQNIVGYADIARRPPAGVSDQVLLTHVQSGEPIRIEDGGATREFVYVRMSTSDPNIIIMRDRATGVERRFPKSKVFSTLRDDGPGEVIPLTPAPAPAEAITDAKVMEAMAAGMKIKINGREYYCISQNTSGDFMLEDVKLGTVAPFNRALVLQAGRVAVQFERANAPAAITDADATARVLAGLEVVLEGERFTYSRPSSQPGCFAMKRADGTEARFTVAQVVAAAKVAMQAEVRPAPAPAPAPAVEVRITDVQLMLQLQADGAKVRLNYGGTKDEYTLLRVSSKDPNILVMKNVRTGAEARMRKSDVFTVMRRRANAAANDEALPLVEVLPTHADFTPGQSYRINTNGRVETWEYVGPLPDAANGDPQGRFSRKVGARTEILPFPLEAAILPTNRVAPVPAPAGEAPLTRADFKLGEVYLVTRSSGEVQRWRYAGVDVDGNPTFEPMVGNEGASNFPIGRIRRMPVAAEGNAPRPAPVPRLSPGAVEVAGIEVKPGDPLITRTNQEGYNHQLRLVSYDTATGVAVVSSESGSRYSVNMADVRAWHENTGLRPGEAATPMPMGTEVRGPDGRSYTVGSVRDNGTVTCTPYSNRPDAVLLPVTFKYKELQITKPVPRERASVESPSQYRGPLLRREIKAGDRVLIITGRTTANPQGIVQEGWVARLNPRSGKVEAFNTTTKQFMEITPETVIHPNDLQQSHPLLRSNPEADFLRRKYEQMRNLPLGQEYFNEFFPPDSKVSQSNSVGNCYLVAGLHSLSQSPNFELLVRASVTPVVELLPDPETRGRTKKEFITGFDVRVPMGDSKGKIVRVTMEDLQDPQRTIAHSYYGLNGPLGFQILEAAYTLSVHGRDPKTGQINRKASDGGLGGKAIQRLIGSEGGTYGCIESEPRVKKSFVEGSNGNQQAVLNFLNNFSIDKHFATVNTPRTGSDRDSFKIRDVNGKEVKMYNTHAYSIQSVNPAAKTVTVINPHDTSKPITMSYATFLETFSDIDFVEINYRGLLR